jgi:organic radical activating enzyme
MRSLDQVNRGGYHAIDFYLSKSCNKSCHYCTAWTLEMRNLTVDMDFLNNTLEMFKDHKIRINLLGGEPGLIKNLTEVIDQIKKYENFVPTVLSNSFVRKRYPWILEDPDVLYVEHLVLDFYGDRIEKLGEFDFFEENPYNNYNLIIKTPGYEEYIKTHQLDVYHSNTILKEYNSRSPTYAVLQQAPELERRICAAFPSVPVVDFEIQKIRHCSKKVINGSRQFDITQDNVNKMMNYELFNFENYCKMCTEKMVKKPDEHVVQIMKKLNESKL